MATDITAIAKEALASKKGLPGIAQLLDLMLLDQNRKHSTIHAAAAAASHVFSKLIERGDFRVVPTASEPEKKVLAWLKDHLEVYTDRLADLLSCDEPALQTFSVDCFLKITRAESTALALAEKNSAEWTFGNSTYLKFVRCLCSKKSSSASTTDLTRHVLGLLNSWDDLKLYFFRNLEKVCKTHAPQIDISIVFDILSQLQPFEELTGDNWVTAEGLGAKKAASIAASKKRKRPVNEDEFDDDNDEDDEEDSSKIPPQSKGAHKRGCSEAWLGYLKIPMTVEIYKKVLLVIHKTVIPQLTQPTLLIDFLTDSYNAGGAISLLALNGLFTLIHEHNL
ncbi:hypothetical protein HDU99_009005, partial [Rhizoclosmatium hyalinum]